jgi:hypothetical protein
MDQADSGKSGWGTTDARSIRNIGLGQSLRFGLYGGGERVSTFNLPCLTVLGTSQPKLALKR